MKTMNLFENLSQYDTLKLIFDHKAFGIALVFILVISYILFIKKKNTKSDLVFIITGGVICISLIILDILSISEEKKTLNMFWEECCNHNNNNNNDSTDLKVDIVRFIDGSKEQNKKLIKFVIANKKLNKEIDSINTNFNIYKEKHYGLIEDLIFLKNEITRVEKKDSEKRKGLNINFEYEIKEDRIYNVIEKILINMAIITRDDYYTKKDIIKAWTDYSSTWRNEDNTHIFYSDLHIIFKKYLDHFYPDEI